MSASIPSTVAARKQSLVERIQKAKAVQAQLKTLESPAAKQAFCNRIAPAPAAPTVPSIPKVGDDVVPVGCFTDNSSRTMLTVGPGLKSMTFDECKQKAADVNARFFSLQAGYACFVTNDPDTFQSLGRSDGCNSIQNGMNMGGGWANYVYQRR